jgi:hypothetical protein
MMLSSGDRRHLRSTLRDAHQYIARMRDPSTGSVAARAKSEGVDLALVAAGVVANGYLSASTENFFHPGGTKIPLDLVGGAAAVAAALYSSKVPSAVGKIGAGVALGYLFKAAAGYATQRRVAANQAPIAITAGVVPDSGIGACLPYEPSTPALQAPATRGLTPAEMAAYSRSF